LSLAIFPPAGYLFAMPPKNHYSVYVVLLDKAALKDRAVLRLNPDRNPKKPCVYVGMTGLSPEQRLENHLNGYKASNIVTKYGVRLLPELYADLNPMSYPEAVATEAAVARNLRKAGFTVTGGK
jgi:hypothetical protein